MLNQLLSNRVIKTPATEVSTDRYEFLALSEAEPDLGVPTGDNHILTATTTGFRNWIAPGDLTGIYGTVYVSTEPPVSPEVGNLWWDVDVGQLFVYYFDGTSYQWVQSHKDILIEGPTGVFTLLGNLIVNDLSVLGTLTETSDKNLKKNINTIENALDVTNKLRGVNFNWKSNDKPAMGLIAQEVEEIIPELVHTNDDGLKTLHYTAIIGLLVEAIKELTDRLDKNGN